MNSAFQSIYLFNDVILVSNESSFGTNGVMRATVIGYSDFGDSKSPIPQFRDKTTGREFYFNGAIFAENSKFYDYLTSYSDAKERWNFVTELNYRNDFRYTMKSNYVEPQKSTVKQKRRWFSSWFNY